MTFKWGKSMPSPKKEVLARMSDFSYRSSIF